MTDCFGEALILDLRIAHRLARHLDRATNRAWMRESGHRDGWPHQQLMFQEEVCKRAMQLPTDEHGVSHEVNGRLLTASSSPLDKRRMTLGLLAGYVLELERHECRPEAEEVVHWLREINVHSFNNGAAVSLEAPYCLGNHLGNVWLDRTMPQVWTERDARAP
jgi:hypothetical protein